MLFITGDIHGEINRFSIENFPIQKKLTKEDYLIIAGDFGLIWDDSLQEKEKRKILSDKNFTTLVIDGNHENFNLLNNYPITTWHGGKVQFITDSIIHLMRGEVYTINDKKIFVMGGATSIDKEYRINNISWWKEEFPSIKEMNNGLTNLEKNNWKVDYIITHDCPISVQHHIEYYLKHKIISDNLNLYLEEINYKTEFEKWFFGHYHFDIKNVCDKYDALYENIIEITS